MSELSTSRRLLQALLAFLLAHIVPRCARVITVSPPIVQEMCKRYHIPEVTLIRNIPEYKEFQKSYQLRKHLGLSLEVRIALYQGNLQPGRGLDELVRAAPFLERDIVIVMMGQDKLAMRAQLESLIALEGCSDRVKIIPPIPYSELLDWTASADIGLIASPPDYSLNIQMLLPNKLFEFLMAGLPVLSTQLDAVVEIIRKYGVGQIMTSLTPADIGTAINAMLADSDALVRMRRNALNATRQELNWEKEQQRLVHLYSSVLAG